MIDSRVGRQVLIRPRERGHLLNEPGDPSRSVQLAVRRARHRSKVAKSSRPFITPQQPPPRARGHPGREILWDGNVRHTQRMVISIRHLLYASRYLTCWMGEKLKLSQRGSSARPVTKSAHKETVFSSRPYILNAPGVACLALKLLGKMQLECNRGNQR